MRGTHLDSEMHFKCIFSPSDSTCEAERMTPS